MNVPKSLALAMAHRGVNDLAALSTISGVHQSTLSKIKNGKLNPSIEILEKIAHSMSYRVSEFCALSEKIEWIDRGKS